MHGVCAAANVATHMQIVFVELCPFLLQHMNLQILVVITHIVYRCVKLSFQVCALVLLCRAGAHTLSSVTGTKATIQQQAAH